MPRQAARLVLGRSAKAKLAPPRPLRPERPFSTTPRRRDDENGSSRNSNNNSSSSSSSNNNVNRPAAARRERTVATASALGAISRSSGGGGRDNNNSNSNSNNNNGSSFRRTIAPRAIGTNRAATLSRPPGLGQAGNNNKIISMDKLPQRAAGAATRTLLRRPPQLGGGAKAPPGSSGFAPRFAGRPGGGAGGRFTGPRPGFGGPRAPGSLRPPGSGGGGFGGRPQRAAGGGGRGGKRSSTGRSAKKTDKDDARLEDMTFGWEQLAKEVQEYGAELDAGGRERPYAPSTTLKSLIGWGPAVATNTAIGQAEIAAQSLRVMGGGRGFLEAESSLEITDVHRRLSAGLPTYYSNREQKKGVQMMLRPDKKKIVERIHDAVVRKLQKKHGNDWRAFVEAYNKRGGAEGIRKKAELLAERDLKRQMKEAERQAIKSKTKEAIIKFAVKGDHPEVKYATDTLGKLAMYHAHERSYRPADGAKFDEKVRTLVKI